MGTQIKHCIYVRFWRCFQIRFVLEMVNSVDYLSNVVEYHPIHWGPEKNKRQKKEEFGSFFFFPPALLLSWAMSFSSVLRLGFVLLAPLLLQASDSDWISWVYCLQRADVGPLCLHYLVRQFLIIDHHLYLCLLYLYLHILLVLIL